MKYAKIAGTGSYLPKKVLTNYDFEKMVDTSHEWILSRTGIEERHIAEQNETIVTMGAAAAQNALSAAKVEAQDIDLIIATTVTPQYFFPSTACMLQKELHCKPCMAFDLNAACSGFIYALDVARRYIENGAIQNALIVSTEVLSRIVDWQVQRCYKPLTSLAYSMPNSMPKAIKRFCMQTQDCVT
jgi:3-oxoacyl-[acyl-carrier-protein] synthase-3